MQSKDPFDICFDIGRSQVINNNHDRTLVIFDKIVVMMHLCIMTTLVFSHVRPTLIVNRDLYAA